METFFSLSILMFACLAGFFIHPMAFLFVLVTGIIVQHCQKKAEKERQILEKLISKVK